MIKILHGQDTVKSRQELEKIKVWAKNLECITLNGQKLTLTDFKQALESKSLFANDRLVILENFLSAKKSKEKEQIIDYLCDEKVLVSLVFWEDEEISKSTLRLFPQAELSIFKLDPFLFRFLDVLAPDNAEILIKLFRQCVVLEEVNFIFYMLVRQFRLLLFLKTGGNTGLDEVDRLAEWQKSKLIKQAQLFDQDKLLQIYRQLLEIDYREKTGLAPYPLTQTLELFLTRL